MKCTTFLLSASIVTLSPSRDGALGFVLGPGLAMRRGNPTTTHDRRLMCHHHGLARPSSSGSIYDRTSGGARRKTIPRALGGSSPSDGADDDSIGGSSSSVGDGAGGLSGDGERATGEEEAEQQSLASLVESTFVLAAAGNSYEMGLKAFISTIKEAYERGYTVPALTMEVSFVPTKVVLAYNCCPVSSPSHPCSSVSFVFLLSTRSSYLSMVSPTSIDLSRLREIRCWLAMLHGTLFPCLLISIQGSGVLTSSPWSLICAPEYIAFFSLVSLFEALDFCGVAQGCRRDEELTAAPTRNSVVV
ncbi:unnamed protein product [Ectocarpus sp. 13 AM-2016]